MCVHLRSALRKPLYREKGEVLSIITPFGPRSLQSFADRFGGGEFSGLCCSRSPLKPTRCGFRSSWSLCKNVCVSREVFTRRNPICPIGPLEGAATIPPCGQCVLVGMTKEKSQSWTSEMFPNPEHSKCCSLQRASSPPWNRKVANAHLLKMHLVLRHLEPSWLQLSA